MSRLTQAATRTCRHGVVVAMAAFMPASARQTETAFETIKRRIQPGDVIGRMDRRIADELVRVCKQCEGEPPQVCGHPGRTTTIAGDPLCEQCARIAAGWPQCTEFDCFELAPPGHATCASHGELAGAPCEVCDGGGYVQCTERDCHGEYCDGTGKTWCATCGETGRVVVADLEDDTTHAGGASR